MAPAALSLLAALGAFAGQPVQTIDVQDAFGRVVTQRGVTLLDWDGFMANPAISLKARLPEGLRYPATVWIQGGDARLLFDRGAPDDRNGIGKRVRLPSPVESVPFLVSIFPDRDGRDDDHRIVIQVTDAQGREQTRAEVPVHVIDQDRPSPTRYPIDVDFSEDRTGFLADPATQAVVRQAAADWAFFLDDQATDTVPARAEKTDVWNPDGFVSTRTVTNAKPYKGYRMVVVGIKGALMRSGGSPSSIGSAQTSHGRPSPLRRSGCVCIEVRGNYHQLGWFVDNDEHDWWCSGSLRDEPADLYSIVMHEMGHALAFQSMYPRARQAHAVGKWIDPDVKAYLGDDPAYDGSDHFAGAVDPASGFGVFGAEYQAKMKVRRWLITKAHLVLLKSLGYRIRPLSCFSKLAAQYPGGESLGLRRGTACDVVPKADGGIPTYLWAVAEGSLPPGIVLDPFTGRLSGIPTEAGAFKVIVRVTDQSPQPMTKALPLEIAVR